MQTQANSSAWEATLHPSSKEQQMQSIDSMSIFTQELHKQQMRQAIYDSIAASRKMGKKK